MAKLGVNIDHVATLREARKTSMPDPVEAARACEAAGCDSIVAHLREDRRHIHDADVFALKKTVRTRFNLEMSIAPGIVAIACKVRPAQATLVPERRQEITTEGGLDVSGGLKRIKPVVARLADHGIAVSLFIDPVKRQIDASAAAGARIIELHTGEYANARTAASRRRELLIVKEAVTHALLLGLEVNAGHGLDYRNALAIACIRGIHELNIGHSIIARAVFTGLPAAVARMVELIG